MPTNTTQELLMMSSEPQHDVEHIKVLDSGTERTSNEANETSRSRDLVETPREIPGDVNIHGGKHATGST